MLEQRSAFRNYDILATTYVYGRIEGPHQGYGGVALVSASTTVNAVTAGIGTFSPVAVGDFLWFYNGETIIKRKVATKASNDQITIDSTPGVTVNIASWYFMPFKNGATAADGWIPIQKFGGKVSVLLLGPTIGDAGGFTFKLEVKGFEQEAAPVLIIEKDYAQADAPISEEFPLPATAAAVRIGLKGTAGFAGTDDVSATVIGDPNR
jgi:hypothetical protein